MFLMRRVKRPMTEVASISKLRASGTLALKMTPQYNAELKAYWRALGALCPEKKRLEYKEQLTKDQISWDVVAASLSLPIAVIRWMMGDNYERNITASM